MISSDLLAAEPDDGILTIMLHELGHALGIGSSRPWVDLVSEPSWNRPGSDAHFQRPAARAAFLTAGGSYSRPGVPLQNVETGRAPTGAGRTFPTS